MSRELTTALLVLLAAAAVGHIAAFGHFAVEDAAISWAYAENIANGHGAVPWVGAEPVEGFSNPTWVALLAVLHSLGVHVYWGSKLLAMSLTAATTFLVASLGARLVPSWPQPAALAAAALFALNTQVGIFGAAGLENPLFNFLLAAGLLRLYLEQDEAERHPWSALWFTALAMTRPEGVAYGLVAGFLTTVVRLRDGRSPLDSLRWWLLFATPFAAWHMARYSYFAWALPATAYAKLPEGRQHLATWSSGGWVYFRQFFWNTGQGMLMPLYVLALATSRGRAAHIGGILLLAGALLYAYPAAGGPFASWNWTEPEGLRLSRCAFPLFGGAVLWASSRHTPHFGTRGTAWAMAMVALFFSVYARGDWMNGFRWMAMAAVPGSALLAAGVCELVSVVRSPSLRWARPVGLVTAVLGFAVLQGLHSRQFSRDLEISPWMVRERVWNGQEAAKRLHVEGRPRMLTVDMGAFLMWSEFELHDIVGLTDMPVAQHRHKPWFPDFFDEHILRFTQPDFMRLGEVMVQLRQIPGFEDQYKRGPFHWRFRKDLFFRKTWPGNDRRVQFEGNALEGWRVPTGPVARGSSVHLEVGLSNADQRDPRWWAFALDDQGRLVTGWELPLYIPETVDWPRDEVYVGRYDLALPAELEPGRYTLGFAMRTLDAWNGPQDGAPLPEGVEVARTPDDARFRWGEVRFQDGFEIGPRDQVEGAALTDLARAHELAGAGSCDEAQRAWFLAGRHGLGDGWIELQADEVHTALSACHFARAEANPDLAVASLLRAHELDPTLPGLDRARKTLADQLQAAGEQALASGDRNAAHLAWRDALRLDPTRTWLRKAQETLRTERLSGG